MFSHRIVGEITDMYVKLVKIDTEFILIDPKENVNTGGEASEYKHDPKWIEK